MVPATCARTTEAAQSAAHAMKHSRITPPFQERQKLKPGWRSCVPRRDSSRRISGDEAPRRRREESRRGTQECVRHQFMALPCLPFTGNLRNQLAMHVREAHMAAVGEVCQALVV